MPEYTLHYFNGRGRAEICRLLFAYADTPFIDKRIDFFKWDGVKSKMPCCMLPILEINGNIQIPQSMTISRYLANEFGFNGSNNIEMANIESITDCLYDVFDNYMRMFYDRNGRKVKRFSSDMRGKYSENESESRKKYLETCNRVLPYLENCLKLQENSGQYFTGDKIKLCDLMCYSAMENPLLENPSLLNDFPKLQRLRKQVYADPNVFSYLKRRNETEF